MFVLRYFRFLRAKGFRATWRASLAEVKTRLGLAPERSRLITDELSFLWDRQIQHQQARESRRINWIIPPPGKGSGGHRTIFRMIAALEADGYQCGIYIYGHVGQARFSRDLTRKSRNWYSEVKAKTHLGLEGMDPSAVIIATNWISAWWLKSIRTSAQKMYFVQDFEPWFYERNSFYSFAEETYSFGFRGITAGAWLSAHLSSVYGMKCNAIELATDYQDEELERTKNKVPRIFCYVRPATGRRGLESALVALEMLKSRGVDFVVDFVGADSLPYDVSFGHKIHGIVGEAKLKRIQQRVDVALILSLSNLSLMPIDFMALGVPVVHNKGHWLTWFLNSENAVLTELSPRSISEGLEEVLVNEEYRSLIVSGGRKSVENLSWKKEGHAFTAIVKETIQCLQE